MVLRNEGDASQSNQHHTPPAGKHFVHQSAFMKQLATSCPIFSFIQNQTNKQTNTFLIEPLLYALHSLGSQNSSGTEEENRLVTWSQRQDSNPSPPDSQTHRWVSSRWM